MTTQANGATQVVHVAPGDGEVIDTPGDVATFMLGSAITGGAVILAEHVCAPGAGPPMLHTHPPDEAFYVLEGEFEFSGLGPDGPFSSRATPGSAIYVPPMAPHNFKNVGSMPGRLLSIYTSPVMESLARDLAAMTNSAADGPPDSAALMPILAKHGVTFVGPAPGDR